MALIFGTISGDIYAVLILLLSIAWYYTRHVYNHWARKELPFLPPTFPFGNFKPTLLLRRSFGDHTNDLYSSTDEPTIGLWTVFHPTLLIRDPAIVRQILIKDFNTFPDRGIYCDAKRDPLSGHLFALSGEKWHHIRGKLTPTFTSGKLKAMFGTIVDCGRPLDAYIDRVAASQGTIEIRELLAQFTTNIIASVAFGIEIDSIARPDTAFRKYGRKLFALSRKNGLRFAIMFLFPRLMSIIGMKSADADVEEFMLTAVKRNMEHREQNNVSRKDFFQLLVQLRNTGTVGDDEPFATTVDSKNKSLSIDECAAHAFVFFAAGFETSSTTMSFALYELARNPECMRRVQQEIDAVLVSHAGQITYESVSEMTYLDCCVDETLRMYPPLPILNRVATHKWTIPNTSITIEKGTSIIIPAYALQTDAKYWTDPKQFKPERFSPEQSAKHNFVDRPYMPFGEGPRNCIGLRLGKMQVKIGLIVMLQKYDYQLAGATRLPIQMSPAAILLTPEGGINVKITHRSQK